MKLVFFKFAGHLMLQDTDCLPKIQLHDIHSTFDQALGALVFTQTPSSSSQGN